MKNYIDEQNDIIKSYYKILSKDFPQFLNDYIYTPEMQKLDGINQICGAYWRKDNIYEDMYSVLKHSVGVALIIWNFTQDKKQTIADNEIPKLSADRLEYTFMNGIYYKKVWDLEEISQIYQDIHVINNEDNVEELGFNSVEIAEKFVDRASKLWPIWVSSEDTITMYFFANIIEKMYNEKYITKSDLYELSEQQIINLIKICKNKKISEAFNNFMKYNNFIDSKEYREDKFCVSRKVKIRYINPITKKGRIYDISTKAKKQIDNFNNIDISKYAYIDI